MTKIRVSTAITITDLGRAEAPERRYVISNEATGKYFSASAETLRFLSNLRRTGDPARAGAAAGLAIQDSRRLAELLIRNGVAVSDRLDAAKGPKRPIESGLVSFRLDLANAGGVAQRLSWFGRVMFSAPMALVWGSVVLFAIAVFAENGDKVVTGLARMGGMTAGGWALFLALFVAVKVMHELGHVLAYRTMCLREPVAPGPIRVGLIVFAGTPFPYTDVTGAWRIASRWRRAMIGAAGIYFETFTVALLVLAWARLDLGRFEPLILQVAVFSGALTLLFNLNPAVKLDGYYILTDLFRQPNLAGRASQAARAAAGRALGVDLPRPPRLELAYWVLSYAYRWSIFAGIFWMAYRFDTRLAPLAAIVACLLLVVRPLVATVRPFRSKMSRTRLAAVILTAVVVGGLLLVPFQARVLGKGQVFFHRTEFIRPPEPVRLAGGDTPGAPVRFEQPDLHLDRLALLTQREVTGTLIRRRGLQAAERAALEGDLGWIESRLTDLDERLARLSPDAPEHAQITPLASEDLLGQWVSTDLERPLVAVSAPSAPYIKLRLDQGRLDPDISDELRARLVGAPDCSFAAVLSTGWAAAVAQDGVIEAEARPVDPLPACAEAVRSGAAIVARIPVPPRSILDRLQLAVSRLLQERLPFETEI